MTGPAPIFEGDLGFFKLVAREAFTSGSFRRRIRQRRRVMINKTYIKFWPAEYHSQSAIDAALQLRAELKRRRVAGHEHRHRDVRGELQTSSGSYPEAWAPKTPRDPSRPQSALLHRSGPPPTATCTSKTFERRTLHEPEIGAFTGKVKVRHDGRTLDPRYPTGIPTASHLRLSDRAHAGEGSGVPARGTRATR